MTMSYRESGEVAARRKNVAGEVSHRPRRWRPASLTGASGRAVGPHLAKCVEFKAQEAPVQIALVVRRAHSDFWCEGHLGDWDGRCGYCIIAGEGYVQSGERRLCLACAEIEAKQVAAAEKAFARAVFAGVKQALTERVGNTWNAGISACSWSVGKDLIRENAEERHYTAGSMSAAQALVSENEQLAKVARSQETITRILEDERRHRVRLAGDSDGAMPLKDAPIDEEVELLVDGIAKEVAVIGALCDSLYDCLESIRSDVDGNCPNSRQDRHGGEPVSGSSF